MANGYPTNGPVLRVGFVGTGGVATRHARILADFPDVTLAASTDVDPARNAAFAEQFGTEVTDGVAALLGHDLDAVYVCVPPFAHTPAEASAEVQIADAGLPLFVEKPLAPDLATAEEIAKRLADAGVLARVGHHWRCAEPLARARAMLAGRPVRLVAATWWDKVPPVSWWPHRDLSGGPVVEQAIHVLDLARVLVGEVAEVSARACGTVPGGDVDAATSALLRFANGAVGTLSTASVLGAKHRAGLEIIADGLVVGLGEDWLEVRDGTAEPARAEFDRWTACVAADRAFVDAVAGRPVDAVTSPPDYADALRSHRLATAIARSAASGTAERLS
jgi:myo-inositol 2-dehydrogenase / D-chiro-inositol 1-dehydrogenase